MSTHFYMYITETKHTIRMRTMERKINMCTFVLLYITYGSWERFPLRNISTKVRQFTRKVGTTIFVSTKFGQLVGRIILSYPN